MNARYNYERDEIDVESERIPSAVTVYSPSSNMMCRYVQQPPACTMKPDGYHGEEHGIYKCSHCGELWQFDCDAHLQYETGIGIKFCPKCGRKIVEVVGK